MVWRIWVVMFLLSGQAVAAEGWNDVLGGESPKVSVKAQRRHILDETGQQEVEDPVIQLAREFDEQFLGFIASGHKEQMAVQKTIDLMKKSEKVSDAGLSADESTIWFTDLQGTPGIYIFHPMEKAQDSSEQPSATADSTELSLNSGWSLSPQSGKKAIILEPFETKDGSGGDLSDSNPELISNLLRQAGFAVEHVRGEDAGVDRFTQLGKYDVVYMHTHCGHKQNNGTWMTGEHITPEKTRKYRQLFGDSVFVGKTGSLTGLMSEETYTITADFIRKIGRFNNSVVYVSGCNSATGKDKNSIARALKERGARTYIGYTGNQLAKYATKNTDVDFFRYLLMNGITTGEAEKIQPTKNYGYAFGANKFSGRLAVVGDAEVTIEVEKSARIDMLKQEYKRLQRELESLKDLIHAHKNDTSSVKIWELQMSEIRARQKEIYALVKSLQQG